MIKPSFFQDKQQNFWQLACIQTASVGILGLFLGGQLAEQFGTPTALLSIAVGNLILWVIGMAMISMSAAGRNHAIETMIKYFGKGSGLAASIILIFTFILWYVTQIELAISTFYTILQHPRYSANFELMIGAMVGLLISLLAMGGIRIIKWICVFALPFLLCFLIYTFANVEHSISFQGPWGLSLSAILTTIAFDLVGMINLPTFFKHSRSKADSFIGLTLMTVLTFILQSSSAFFRYDKPSESLTKFLSISFNYYFIVLFILISLICINLINIYFASAGSETIVSRFFNATFHPAIGYAVFGLAGTALFVFLKISPPLLFLIDLTADFYANLGIILMLSFLVSIIIHHRKRTLEKFVNNTCWFIGCVVSLVVQYRHPQDLSLGFMWGIGASVFAFLVAAFIAETAWSLNTIRSKKPHRQT